MSLMTLMMSKAKTFSVACKWKQMRNPFGGELQEQTVYDLMLVHYKDRVGPLDLEFRVTLVQLDLIVDLEVIR